MKSDTYYSNLWLTLAKAALERAKVYGDVDLHDQSLRASEIGHYCMKRYEKAHLKFISAKRERAQQTAGTIFALILLTVIVHYIITHML